MMLSGLGPADQLRKHGIGVAVDLPGVGENLQDHHEAPVMAETRRNLGYYKQDRGLPMLLNGLQYTFFKSGPVSSNGVEACAFTVPEDGGGDPIIKIYCVPTTTYRDPDVKGVPTSTASPWTSVCCGRALEVGCGCARPTPTTRP